MKTTIDLRGKHGIGKVILIDIDDYNKLKDYKISLLKIGYAVTYIKEKMYYIHRLILNAKSNEQVDHINGNPLDNRKCNLRLSNQNQNMHNMSKRKKKTSSKYKGVTWHKALKKWMAQIGYNSKHYYIGIYKNEKEAAIAYNKKAKELFGEFAKLNII